jgi:hypothetical protein
LSLLVGSLLWALVWLLLSPGELLAWGPATHIAIGQGVLSSAHLLPPTARALLEKHPVPFLYGSVAADISFAKKYAPAGRHCHHWHIGREILDTADTEELGAVALGYLSHLAADTIAHNIYVPRRLLITPTSQSLGHTYWEYRMDVRLGERFLGEARSVVLRHDHSAADDLFDRVLSRTLFSFKTNRRIFRGMIAFQDYDRWKQVFDKVLKRSRFDLPIHLRDRYVQLSFDYVMDYRNDPDRARAAALDPIGEVNLKLAKAVRRQTLSAGEGNGPEVMEPVADEFFPLPGEPLLYVPRALPLEIPGMALPGEIRTDAGPAAQAKG